MPATGTPSAPASSAAVDEQLAEASASRPGRWGRGRPCRRPSGASRQPSTRRFSSAATLLDPRDGGRGLLVVRGQERGAHRVRPGGGQREVDDGTQELVRNLDQDAHAVAGVVLGAARTAVLEPQQRREAPADDLVVAAAREVGHQGDTAGVVLVLGGVHTGGRGNRPVARGSQEFLLSSRCTPTPASGRRSYVVRSVGCTRCTDQLVRSGEPDMSSPRTGESLRTAVGQSGRLGEGIGRPGYGSDRTQRRGRFSRSQASHAVRQERQRKSSERGDAARPCVSGVLLRATDAP